jgi:hypothetical protein
MRAGAPPAATVRIAEPGTVSLVAVMVAVPRPAAVTSPDDETVATAALLEVQVTARPLSEWPVASQAVAIAAVV